MHDYDWSAGDPNKRRVGQMSNLDRIVKILTLVFIAIALACLVTLLSKSKSSNQIEEQAKVIKQQQATIADLEVELEKSLTARVDMIESYIAMVKSHDSLEKDIQQLRDRKLIAIPKVITDNDRIRIDCEVER